MKCPACNEPELVIVDRHGIEVDYCPECRGVWLERGELDNMLSRSREEDDEDMRERTVERAERHQRERQEHRVSRRHGSTRLVERIFDF